MNRRFKTRPAVDRLQAEGRCDMCGYDPQPDPAVDLAELVGLSQRWTALASGVHRAGWALDSAHDGVSLVVAHASAVRDMLHVKANRIALIRDEVDPRIDDALGADHPVVGGQPVDAVLKALSVNVRRFVRTAHTMAPASWSRTGRRGAESITALHLLHEAVHEAMHHLWAACEILERGDPFGR